MSIGVEVELLDKIAPKIGDPGEYQRVISWIAWDGPVSPEMSLILFPEQVRTTCGRTANQSPPGQLRLAGI